MEPTNTDGGAGSVSDAAGAIAQKPPAESKKRGGKKATDKAVEPQAVAEQPRPVVRFEIDPKQLQEALRPMLAQLAKSTRTAPPIKTRDVDEVGAIAETFTYGLRHTDLGVSEKSGPWVPFGIVLGAYVVPRMFEGIMNYLDAREKRRAEAEKPSGFSQGSGDLAVPSGVSQAKSGAPENAWTGLAVL